MACVPQPVIAKKQEAITELVSVMASSVQVDLSAIQLNMDDARSNARDDCIDCQRVCKFGLWIM
jgi:hypothetical protein